MATQKSFSDELDQLARYIKSEDEFHTLAEISEWYVLMKHAKSYGEQCLHISEWLRTHTGRNFKEQSYPHLLIDDFSFFLPDKNECYLRQSD
ncbi:MAG TPA: hypothetical protein PL009_02975 [Flavipsychrobacter sp.]|nr:hypothetical protein [Flavipsychrobacter sp.]